MAARADARRERRDRFREAGGDGQAEAVDQVEHVLDDACVAALVGAGHPSLTSGP